MTLTGDNGNLSIDFLVGFTIFLLAFIWVVSMIPGLLINLQGYTIDYDAVAYRTGVILAEDPGEPSLPTSINPWENLLSSEGVIRFGLAVSKDTPNILSQKKVNRFFCLSEFSYPIDYQNRTIFGDYLYQFNISLIEMGSDHPPRFVGDIIPATSSYGSIRRLVKIKEPSIAVVNASSFDITGNYDPTARPDLLSGENETVHEFIILINKSELLEDTVRNPIYQIDPARERTIINITHLDQTMPLDRKDCFNISLTKITIINEMGGLFVTPPIPNYKYFIDGVQYNQSSSKPYINNNISLLFDPPTYWSVTDKSYINLTFTLTPNSTCSGPGGIFSGPDPVRGSRFLNNTLTSPFGYNYSPKNVIQPQLRGSVLEIKIGSGARTVTETVIEGLVAAFKWDWNVGGTPITVNFMDQSTGSHTDYYWDFGDGTSATLNNPTHTYTNRGDYTVTLTVKNSTGGSATSQPQIIKIREITATTGANGNISPTGAVLVAYGTNQAFTITPNTGYQIADVLVDGVSNGTISSYTFNNVVADRTISVSFMLALAPTVTSITPDSGVNTTTISITNLAGANFLAGATVKLNRTGYPDIPGTSVNVVSPNQINCTFDLTSKTAGLWNVAVINADGKSGMLANGFTITAPLKQFYYEGFESGSTGWVITAGSRQNGAGIPKNQTWVMRLRNTNSMYRPTSTAGYNNIIVQFAWALTSDTAGENAYAEYSTNGGTSWATLSLINGPVNQLSLNIFTSPILPPGADNNANFQLRFRITGSSTADILYIDDVSVSGVPI